LAFSIFEMASRITTSQGEIFIEGTGEYLDGKKVFKNEEREKLDDGKYKIGFLWYAHVRNGVITHCTII
jgi:hypothetical protein